MIVITTPTGDIGSQVLRLLLDDPTYGGGDGGGGEDLRVVVRDPARLPDDVRASGDRVDVVVGSHGDADVVDRALAGADAVFWCVPPNSSAPSMEAAYLDFTRPAVEALRRHAVAHVVGVSALGRGTAWERTAGLVTTSLDTDDLIATSGAAYRALANPSFMDNRLREVATIRDEGVFRGPLAADRPVPTAATRDIAAAAARLLVDRSWSGVGEQPVLGPEDLSPDQEAAIMTEVLGRPVRYERRPFEELAARMTSFGMGEDFVQGWLDMMRAKDAGLDAGVARTAETAGPTTFREWCATVLRPAVEAG